MLPFYALRKHQNISGFQVFSGGIKVEHLLLAVSDIPSKVNPSLANIPILYSWKHRARDVQGVKNGDICLKWSKSFVINTSQHVQDF